MGAALFPYNDNAGKFVNNTFYKSLRQVGIGALPFLPGQQEYVTAWLRGVLRQSGWALSDRVIDHRLLAERARRCSECNEPVLVVRLRVGSDELDQAQPSFYRTAVQFGTQVVCS